MRRVAGSIFILVAFMFMSCQLPQASDPPSDEPSIESLLSLLAGLSQPAGLETGTPQALAEAPLEDPVEESREPGLDQTGTPVTYITTTQKFKASAAFDTQILLNPSTDVVYPGSVILGHTIDDGSYQEVTRGTKREVTVSYDLVGVRDTDGNAGTVSGTIVPTLSNYRTLHNQILSQDVGPQSTIYSYEALQFSSESEFSLKLKAGAGFKSPTFETQVHAGFDFTQGNTRNKYMIKFMQTFYTVDIDQGQGTFLYSDFNIDDFNGYRPVYVSSIAYGRLAYLTIESEDSWTEIQAHLDGMIEAVQGGGIVNADIEADVNYNYFESMDKLNITVIGDSIVTTGVSGFKDFLVNGGFSSANPGKIISYKLRFVDDNAVANTIFNGEYTVRNTSMQYGGGIRIGARVTWVDSQCDDAGDYAEYSGHVLFSGESFIHFPWSWSEAKKYVCTDVGKTRYYGLEQFITFPSGAKQFTLEILGLREHDTGADEIFEYVTRTLTVSEIDDGDTLKLRSYKQGTTSNWVDFTIQFSKENLE